MDETIKHYIYTVLPYRLYALGLFTTALHLAAEFPDGADILCTFDGKPKIHGKSTAITNPSIEMGIVHSRVLLEFLGLKAESETKLVSIKPRPTDISIKNFNLNTVSVKQALSHCNGDKALAEAAIARTLTAANKLIAHSTHVIKIDNDSIEGYLMTCKAISVLFNLTWSN
jgi:hypothetical protein